MLDRTFMCSVLTAALTLITGFLIVYKHQLAAVQAEDTYLDTSSGFEGA